MCKNLKNGVLDKNKKIIQNFDLRGFATKLSMYIILH